ncbi:hypothetical protein GOD94_27640 [Sinorhizobium medicae]|nr:hypothetical protein [Sinorhizobium medicae]MDX0876607.1 hypothetical protein [Sinorhizobium medicae]
MIGRLDENPFDLVKASDFSAAEILEYWVDISNNNGGLVQLLQPKLRTPMLILGGKGSGKTHLMRYCSAPVQAARAAGNLAVAVAEEGYLGIYVPAEGLNSHKFAGKGQSSDLWLAIFNMYFELWLATTLLTAVKDGLHAPEPVQFDEASFVAGVADSFDVDVSKEFNTIETLIAFLTRLRKRIDYAANNVAITGQMDPIEIPFSPGRLVFGLPSQLAKTCSAFTNTIFIYLIDEAENFTSDQQQFLNTLIRYRVGNATFRIGARLYGIRTFQTLGSGEPIKLGSEFVQLELDGFLRDHESEYLAFASKLVLRRLQQAGSVVAAGVDAKLSDFFEELDKANNYQKPLLKILDARDKAGKERPYFKKLKKQLTDRFDQPAEWSEKILSLLKRPDHPLLEKLNIFLLYREWSDSAATMLRAAEEINRIADDYVAGGSRKSSKYADILAHFDSDLLAQLYRDCGQNVPYCGLDAIIHLSQGIPRNLLGIMKQIYRRSLFNGEKPFAGGQISAESQSLGALDSAAWFWEDAQPDTFGVEARESVESLAVLFRTIRYSDKPSECDLCTFAVDEEKLTRNAREVLQAAENWSYLIKVPLGHKGKTHRVLEGKYQLGPMLAPRWGVSIYRRGTLALQPDLANALLDHSRKDDLRALFLKRVGGMFVNSSANEKQKSLL